MALTDLLRDVEAIRGWDWSRCRTRTAPFGWVYEDVLASFVAGTSRVIDVGTGGGEVFSAMARRHDVAIDISTEMLAVARSRLDCPLVAADQRALPFAPDAFDVVAARHVGCDPGQVLTVLRPGGIYVTQQVGGRICQNIFDALGWGSNASFWRGELGSDYWDVARMADFYEAQGCEVLRRSEADVDHEFEDEASLAYWLVNAPLPPLPADRDLLNALLLRTNWHAELLVVRR